MEPFPDPSGEVLAGGILEPGNLVQIIMIQAVEDWLEGRRDIRVIHKPSKFRIAFACHDNFDDKTVAVQTAALMGFGQIRQEVCGFELKVFAEFDLHTK